MVKPWFLYSFFLYSLLINFYCFCTVFFVQAIGFLSTHPGAPQSSQVVISDRENLRWGHGQRHVTPLLYPVARLGAKGNRHHPDKQVCVYSAYHMRTYVYCNVYMVVL